MRSERSEIAESDIKTIKALDFLIVFELITAATKMRKVVSYTKFAILSSTIKN